MEDNYYEILNMCKKFNIIQETIKKDILALVKEASYFLVNDIESKKDAEDWIKQEKNINCFPIVDGPIGYNTFESDNYTIQYFCGMNRKMKICFFKCFSDSSFFNAEEINFEDIVKYIGLENLEILYRELHNFIEGVKVGLPKFEL